MPSILPERSELSSTPPRPDDDIVLLPGFPGYRTRPGRSGLDYIDTQIEMAHMAGLLLRRLFSNTWRRRGIDPHPLITLIVGIMLWIAFPGDGPVCLGVIVVLLIALIAAGRKRNQENKNEEVDTDPAEAGDEYDEDREDEDIEWQANTHEDQRTSAVGEKGWPKLRKHILREMNLKPTEELWEIWTSNNHTEWTDEAFDVIKEVLLDRLGEVPPQNPPIYPEPSDFFLLTDLTEAKRSRAESKGGYQSIKKWIFGPFIGYILIYCIYSMVHEWTNGQQTQPDVVMTWMLLILGVILIWLGIDLLWTTWFREAVFVEHLKNRVIPIQKKYTLPFFRWLVPASLKYYLWNYRLASLAMIVFGIISLMLSYSSWRFFNP